MAADVSSNGPSDRDLDERLQLLAGAQAVDVLLAHAVRRVVREQQPDVLAVRAALQEAPLGAAAWHLPVEPMLRPMRDVRWGPVLALLRSRAA
jgi:hypothetical protein